MIKQKLIALADKLDACNEKNAANAVDNLIKLAADEWDEPTRVMPVAELPALKQEPFIARENLGDTIAFLQAINPDDYDREEALVLSDELKKLSRKLWDRAQLA